MCIINKGVREDEEANVYKRGTKLFGVARGQVGFREMHKIWIWFWEQPVIDWRLYDVCMLYHRYSREEYLIPGVELESLVGYGPKYNE